MVVKNWDDAVTSSINYQYNKESNEYSFSFNSPGKSTFGFFFNKIGKGVAGYTVGRIIKPMVANSNSLIRKALEKQSKALIEAGKYSRTIIKPKSPAQTRIKELVFTQKSQDAFQATLNADVAAAKANAATQIATSAGNNTVTGQLFPDSDNEATATSGTNGATNTTIKNYAGETTIEYQSTKYSGAEGFYYIYLDDGVKLVYNKTNSQLTQDGNNLGLYKFDDSKKTLTLIR